MSDKIYYKISRAEMRSDHFYKYYRFVFFRRFIFTIDIYPTEMNFGFMISSSNMSKILWSFK